MKARHILLSLLAASTLIACEDYTEHNFGKPEDLWQATEVNTFEFTLGDADYKNIAGLAANKQLADSLGLSADLENIATRKAFQPATAAAAFLPAYLPTLLGSKYYAATAGTTVKIQFTQELVKDSVVNGPAYVKFSEAQLTEGQYLLVPAGTDLALASSKADGEYGYASGTTISRIDSEKITTNEASNGALWSIEANGQSWMLRNQADVFAYLDETHASFQFVEDYNGDLDDPSVATWSVTRNEDGTYAFLNDGRGRTIWYDPTYKSAGAYSEKKDGYLGIELYRKANINTTIQVSYTEPAEIVLVLDMNEETGNLEWNASGAYLNQTLTDLASIDAEEIYQNYGWSLENVNMTGDLTYVWSATTSYGLKASAYKSANIAAESWAISPVLNLKKAKAPIFSFEQAQKYAGTPLSDYLQVWVSTDYQERGDQAKATWQNVTDQVVGADGTAATAWPDGSNWDFISSQIDLSRYAGQPNVHVAFRYISTDQKAATWEFKNVLCKEAE